MSLWVSNLGKTQWDGLPQVYMESAGLIYVSVATCQVSWGLDSPRWPHLYF